VSAYRFQNYEHLAAVTWAEALLRDAPIPDVEAIDAIRRHVVSARGNAEWCLDAPSGLEKRLMLLFGAGPAFAICETDIVTADEALRQLDAFERGSRATGAGSFSPFALSRALQDALAAMRADSLAFQPHVTRLEAATTALVKRASFVTTLLVLCAVGALLFRLARSARHARQQAKRITDLAAIAERTNDSIVMTCTEGRVTWVNPAFTRLTGYTLDEIRGCKPGAVLQGPQTDLATQTAIREAIASERQIRRDILNYTRDGAPYWISLNISPLHDDGGRHYGFVAVSSDITERITYVEDLERAKREIEHQALHDTLTNLPNRRAFDNALSNQVAAVRAGIQQSITVLRIDLDHFKVVNDTQGHGAGDRVLREVAHLLETLTDPGDMPARVGGDEFVVLLSPERDAKVAAQLGEDLLDVIRAPIPFGERVLRVGASFGVACSSDPQIAVDQVLLAADAALYEAKEAGRNRLHLYNPALHKKITDDLEIAAELKTAIAEEQFVPVYQPQISVQTMRPTAVETLARWNSPRFGLVKPDAFIPVATKMSLVDEIDAIIFRKAIRDIASLRAQGFMLDKVSFNVTASRIQDPALLALVRRMNPGDLTIAFEVLESVLVEDQGPAFRMALDNLREAGISIEVDDYGSGHASIMSVLEIEPDGIKIERALVQRMLEAPKHAVVVQNIAELAKGLGINLIAEGVETLEHADRLTRMGCDSLQGFFFAKPLSCEALHVFLSRYGTPPGVRSGGRAEGH
jgi:diguanylate cyclase (GGDEF)-like protein/PAS domain S-box-containing protein